MTDTKSALLPVQGAKLYYQVRGSGPILLLIAAGAGDADSYNSIADYLVDKYTVVTYDRRGYSRSVLDNSDQLISIETHSDDVHHLLVELTSEPAYVFGCSIGALIGLDLAIHNSGQVHALIAHEPPVGQLMPAIERTDANLLEMYQTDGATEAIRKFAASIGVTHSSQESNIGLPQKNARTAASNRESFFKHDASAVARYTLDLTALQAAHTRIIVAGGREGRAYFPYRCAAALADHLGTSVVEFPGHHAGFVDHPKEFAEKLHAVLGN